jgi:hypothetical protein
VANSSEASNSSDARPQIILLEKAGNKIKGPGGPPFEKCVD